MPRYLRCLEHQIAKGVRAHHGPIHAARQVAPVHDHEEVEDGESQLVDGSGQPGGNGADRGERSSGGRAYQAERVNL